MESLRHRLRNYGEGDNGNDVDPNDTDEAKKDVLTSKTLAVASNAGTVYLQEKLSDPLADPNNSNNKTIKMKNHKTGSISSSKLGSTTSSTTTTSTRTAASTGYKKKNSLEYDDSNDRGIYAGMNPPTGTPFIDETVEHADHHQHSSHHERAPHLEHIFHDKDGEGPPGMLVVLGAVANLCSATLGAGILSLPYAFVQAGLLAGFGMLFLAGFATISSIRLLTAACEQYQIFSYEDLVQYHFGKSARRAVEACTIAFCGGCAVAYVIAVGDILEMTHLFVTIGPDPQDEAKQLIARDWSMIVIWIVLMLPLSLLRTMKSLQWSSSIGIASIGVLVLAAFFHLVQDAWDDMERREESHDHNDTNPIPAGAMALIDNMTAWFNATADESILADAVNIDQLEEQSEKILLDWTRFLWPVDGMNSILTACPIILFAFSCQVNVAAIYQELTDVERNIHPLDPLQPQAAQIARATASTLTIMDRVTWMAVAICAFLYATLSCITVADFGHTVTPNILKSYIPPTGIMQMACACMGVAVILAFPLNIFPARHTLSAIIEQRRRRRRRLGQSESQCCLTAALLEDGDAGTIGSPAVSDFARMSSRETLDSRSLRDIGALEMFGAGGLNASDRNSPETAFFAAREGDALLYPPSSSSDEDDLIFPTTTLQRPYDKFPWKRHVTLTLLLAGSALGLALVAPNISIVFGLLGGTVTSILGFVVPGALGLRLCRDDEQEQLLANNNNNNNNETNENNNDNPRNNNERDMKNMIRKFESWLLILGGVVVGVVTTFTTIYSTLFSS